MFAAIGLVLTALVASAQGFSISSCALCMDYCCTNFLDNDSHHCCGFEEYYYKGGFLTQQTVIIAGAVAAIILLLLFCLCCCCCSCCPCYRRRQSGAVYNSVVPLRGSAIQPSAVPYYFAQYPQQHPPNSYIAPNPSAPPAYPTLPPPSQA